MTENFDAHTSEQVADVIRWAASEKAPIELVSGGTKRGFGQLQPGAGRLPRLNLSGLSGITSYQPEELVITAGSGTRLGELEQALAEQGQQFGFEPPDWGPLFGGPAGEATLGGIVGTNLSGPRRLGSGAARDHVLGLSCVSGRGESFKCGGRVVKNVTGYDLCKLMTGSFGTLAALTEITMRVVPAPERTATVLVFELDEGDGSAVMASALSGPADVSGAAYIPAGIAAELPIEQGAVEPSVTALRLEGPDPSVEDRLRLLRSLDSVMGADIAILDDPCSKSFWTALRDVEPFSNAPVGALWRVHVPPACGSLLAMKAAEELKIRWFCDWGGGLVWLAIDDECADGGAEVIRSAATQFHGQATLIRGPCVIRERNPVFSPPEPALARVSAQIKDAFDPKNILNPGRMTLSGHSP
jgi:glycolate oxidase FAD binding subunit